MAANPFERVLPKKELPKELQNLFDDFFVHFIAGLNCYGGCEADKDEEGKSLRAVVGYLCTQKGLPGDKLEESRGRYVIYLSEDRSLDSAVFVDFEMDDYDEDMGKVSFELDVHHVRKSDQDWQRKFELEASSQALEKLKLMKKESEERLEAENEASRKKFQQYLPGALSFMRSHGNGMFKPDELGTLQPMLKEFYGWDPGPEDTIKVVLDETYAQWVLELLHPNGSVYDIAAIDDKS